MNGPLRVLVVEDDPDDAELVDRELRRGFDHVEMERVATEAELTRALTERTWDLILSDHKLAGFDSLHVLSLARSHELTAPVIVVSGALGDEAAVAVMRAGAADFVPKSNLTRLNAAITRERAAAEARVAARTQDQALRLLYDVARASCGLVDVARLGQLVVDHVREALRVEFVTVWTLDSSGRLAPLATNVAGVAEDTRLTVGLGIAGRVADRRDAVVVPAYSAWGTQAPPPEAAFASGAGVPLLAGDRVVGALVVGRTLPATLGTPEIELLKLFASEIAPAIEVRRLYDIGELRRMTAETLDLRIQQLVASAPVLLFSFDRTGIFTFVEGRGLATIGLERERLLGRSLLEILGDVPQVARAMSDGLSGRTGSLALPFRERQLEIHYGPTRQDGNVDGVTGVVIDVTERTAAEEAERRRRTSEAASRAKSEFLSAMSHELRTPLNAILGFSELLLEQLGDRIDEKQRRYLRNVHDSGTHLLSLVNDVLDLSKVEAGKLVLHPEVISADALLESAVAAARASATAKGLRLDVAVDVADRLSVDPLRFRQILLNLLSNAVKYTEAGSVALSVTEDQDDLVVTVTDTGVGIPEGDRERLFGAFERLRETNRGAPGTGLGLAVTKRLVELQGGTIEVESTEGRGSTFRVCLPGVARHAADGAHVLVVEPEGRDADLVAALASAAGIQCEIVATASDALAAIDAHPPLGAVIATADPTEARAILARLRRAAKPIRSLVITSADDLGWRALGADAHLRKPIEQKELAAWLRELGATRPAPHLPDRVPARA